MTALHSSLVLLMFGASWVGCHSVDDSVCEGLACPTGRLCAVVSDSPRCVLPEQLGSCATGQSACSFGDVTGACVDDVCVVVSCGNQNIDPGETCDDGNTAGGDGCSADCASAEVCGNGITDVDAGEQCDDGRHCEDGITCAEDGECDGVGDGACRVRSADGCQANCRLPTCGDAIKDEGEACDNGMHCDDGGLCTSDTDCQGAGDGRCIPRFGDGCNAICSSTETCGNGWIDAAAGEVCDDNNARSHDGCSSGCAVESPAWRELPNTPVDDRFAMAFAYHNKIQRPFIHGGYATGVGSLQNTFEWTGRQWVENLSVVTPPTGTASMTYDSARDRLVLVVLVQFDHMETWVFKAGGWKPIEVGGLPTRSGFSLTYDSARDRVVLFGGGPAIGIGKFNDTWEFDGIQWAQVTTTNAPAGRSDYAFTYDETRAVVVLFGGDLGGGAVSFPGEQTTWEYDGTNWNLAPPANTDSPCWGVADCMLGMRMVYDQTRGVIVAISAGLTWEYDGAAWATVSTAVAPPARQYAALMYDQKAQHTVLFGGIFGGTTRRETWIYDGATWTDVTDGATPPDPRSGARLVTDESRGVVVMWDFSTKKMWEHDGYGWSEVPVTGTNPSVFGQSALAYDSDRELVYLFGGDGPGGASNELWEYKDGAWSLVVPMNSTGARVQHGMTYDRSRQRLVVVGGAGGSEAAEYDPATNQWTELAGPTRRLLDAAVVYDPAAQVTLLFGGRFQFLTGNDPSALADTWTFDGVTWAEVPTLLSPPERWGAAMAYDDIGERILLYAGERYSPTHGDVPHTNDLWSYKNGIWSPLVATTPPPWRRLHGMSAAPWVGGVLVFGGETHQSYSFPTADETFGDTWLFSMSSASPDERCDNDFDDDNDGKTDCDDPDCGQHQVCVSAAP